MTKIQWCDETWNPVTGCTKVSAGCKNCYAEKVAGRWWGERKFTDVRTHEDRLDAPLRWRKPRRVFVNSMSDLFHEDVPDSFVDQVFAVMALAPRHQFLVLTKRSERMRACLQRLSKIEHRGCHCDVPHAWDRLAVAAHEADFSEDAQCQVSNAIEGVLGDGHNVGWPMRNVWLGISVEDQATADERIPVLLDTPAAMRFVSYEPALGPVDFRRHGVVPGDDFAARPDWIIAGGESGPGARPCDVAWIRSTVEQCKAAGVPVFVKQLGAKMRWNGCSKPGEHWLVPTTSRDVDGAFEMQLRDPKGGDPDEWPEDLRVRQFPEAKEP